MVKPIDTAKMLDLLSTMHTKEAQLVERLRLAGIGETTIARAMHTSPQAIAKRFPRSAVARTTRAVTARTTRATTAPRRATTPRKRAAAPGRTRTRARARA